jgi:hypothetical protein
MGRLVCDGVTTSHTTMGGMWTGLQRFLDDSAVSVDNNATERALIALPHELA